MTSGTEFTIGAEVRCSDGPGGEVRKVVVDPVARAITHLVVEEPHREGLGRLVALDLVAQAGPPVELSLSVEELSRQPRAEEMQFLPGSMGLLGYEPPDVLPLPYYMLGANDSVPPTVGDEVPKGEVAFHRDQPVRATDGEIGRVEGFVVDPSTHAVTHVLLQEGHGVGRQDVAIPIEHVTSLEGGITLDLSKDEVRDLPAVAVRRHPG